jgi:RNA polymerase sigma factor (sigma-70 family)
VGNDFELLQGWREGDGAAGSELVERHFRGLYRFFHGKVDDADELLQRTFLAAVEARDRIADGHGFRAFLFGVARRQLLLYYREQHRAGRRVDPMGNSTRSPSALLGQREELRTLLTALRKLPIDAQILVELRYWEDLSVPEIAAVLEVPEGTVKSRLSRIRSQVERLMSETDASEALVTNTIRNFERWARSLRDIVPTKDRRN